MNKTDAGNGSKAICRVSNVLRAPSLDPGHSPSSDAGIPPIEAPEVEHLIAEIMPDALITTETISPIHGSWRIEIIREGRRFAFVWGPISGFGGIDYSVPSDDVFAYCDEYLWSLDDARKFLSNRI